MSPNETNIVDAIEPTEDIEADAAPAVAIIDEDVLRGKIYEIHGQKVMLDFELAEIYGYTTKAFNQQVRRNIEKFDGNDFMFQLTEYDWQILRSQIATSRSIQNDAQPDLRSQNVTAKTNSKSGDSALQSKNATAKLNPMSRTLPHAFTEQGVYMLMTVLRGELATKQSRALIRLFKRMKDQVEAGRDLVGRREFLDLSLKLNDSLSESLRLRHDLRKVEDDVAALFDEMGDVVRKSDIGDIMKGFGEAAGRYGFLIMDGQPVEAAAAYAEIYEMAKHSVFIVDNYVGARTLGHLAAVRSGVCITLFTDNKSNRLRRADIEAFHTEYPENALEVHSAGNFVHDRYIIIDYEYPNESVYHCGASSKDAGKRFSSIVREGHPELYHPLVERLLEQPPLELP